MSHCARGDTEQRGQEIAKVDSSRYFATAELPRSPPPKAHRGAAHLKRFPWHAQIHVFIRLIFIEPDTAPGDRVQGSLPGDPKGKIVP